MIKVNLLPVREARRKIQLIQFGAFTLLCVGLAAAACMMVEAKVKLDIVNAEKRFQEVSAQLDRLQPELKKVEEFQRKKEDVQSRLDVIASLEASRRGPVQMMEALAMATPPRLWVTNMSAKGKRIEFQGLSLDNETVAIFLGNLGDSPYFGNVTLESTETVKEFGLRLSRFKVNAALTSPKDEKKEEGTDGENTAG